MLVAIGSGRMAHWSDNKCSAVPAISVLLCRLRRAHVNPIRKNLPVMDLLVFMPLIVIMGAFMYFASRRQKKAMQATIDLHESLRVGDRVHTTSGLVGIITAITDDNVDLEIAPGVVTTWMKLAVRDRITDESTDDVTNEAMELTDSDADRLTKD
jgi:preprotein translocase subunit YajC